MLRLVQGDVGCGKTLVAALAATQAVQTGRQVALMAPTELLADQHAQNFKRWFEPLGVTVALLTGRQTGKRAAASLAAFARDTPPSSSARMRCFRRASSSLAGAGHRR
jgi:ATP-dependent DNA helicase RecG